MRPIDGVRIIENGWVPTDKAYAMMPPGVDPPERPEDWDSYTEEQRFGYLLAHGAVLVINSLAAFRAHNPSLAGRLLPADPADS